MRLIPQTTKQNWAFWFVSAHFMKTQMSISLKWKRKRTQISVFRFWKYNFERRVGISSSSVPGYEQCFHNFLFVLNKSVESQFSLMSLLEFEEKMKQTQNYKETKMKARYLSVTKLIHFLIQRWKKMFLWTSDEWTTRIANAAFSPVWEWATIKPKSYHKSVLVAWNPQLVLIHVTPQWFQFFVTSLFPYIVFCPSQKIFLACLIKQSFQHCSSQLLFSESNTFATCDIILNYCCFCQTCSDWIFPHAPFVSFKTFSFDWCVHSTNVKFAHWCNFIKTEVILQLCFHCTFMYGVKHQIQSQLWGERPKACPSVYISWNLNLITKLLPTTLWTEKKDVNKLCEFSFSRPAKPFSFCPWCPWSIHCWFSFSEKVFLCTNWMIFWLFWLFLSFQTQPWHKNMWKQIFVKKRWLTTITK